jgi:S1-C subfamily serine protease
MNGRARHLVAGTAIALVLATGACGGSTTVASEAAQTRQTTTTTTPPGGGSSRDSFANIPQVVQRVQPSVVTIETPDGLGSGVVWSSDGTIVTDAHVVGSHHDVQVDFADGRQVAGTVQATDPVSDLAVVKAERTGLTAARFETQQPALGDLVIAIGSPLGFVNSVTAGIVSGESRSIPGSASQTQSLVGLIQTDAAVSPGNSGGALVNGDGDVIGIVEAYIPPSQGAVSIGFAIPASTVVDIVRQLLATGKAAHAFLGIQPATLTPDIQKQLGSNQKTGVVVIEVTAGSPAADAGVKRGDVIVSIDGKTVSTAEDLIGALRQHKPGDKIEVVYVRDNDRHTTSATLTDRPPS